MSKRSTISRLEINKVLIYINYIVCDFFYKRIIKRIVKQKQEDTLIERVEIMSIYFQNVSMEALQKGLDAVWLRQQVISNNIANNNTAGFKSSTVEFESLLSDVLDRNYTSMNSIQNAVDRIQATVVENENTSVDETGNNVDLDKENIELARAQLQYSYLVSSLTSQIDRLKYAINGGN